MLKNLPERDPQPNYITNDTVIKTTATHGVQPTTANLTPQLALPTLLIFISRVINYFLWGLTAAVTIYSFI